MNQLTFSGGWIHTRHEGTAELLRQAGFPNRLPLHSGVADFHAFRGGEDVAGIFPLNLHAAAYAAARRVWSFEMDHIPGQGGELTAEELLARRPRLVRYDVEAMPDAAPRAASCRSYFHRDGIADWLVGQGIRLLDRPDGFHRRPRAGMMGVAHITPESREVESTFHAPGQPVRVTYDRVKPAQRPGMAIIGHALARHAAEVCVYGDTAFYNVDISDMPFEARGGRLTANELASYGAKLVRYHVSLREIVVPAVWANHPAYGQVAA
jgi:hypothetical protein